MKSFPLKLEQSSSPALLYSKCSTSILLSRVCLPLGCCLTGSFIIGPNNEKFPLVWCSRERERELLLKLSPLDSEDMGVTHGKKVSLSIFKKCFLYLGHLSLYSSPVKVIHQKHPCGKNTFLLAWSVFERITVRVCTLINDICSVNCVYSCITLKLFCGVVFYFPKTVNSCTNHRSLSNNEPCQRQREGLGECLSRHVLLILLHTVPTVGDLAKQHDSSLINQTAAAAELSLKCLN